MAHPPSFVSGFISPKRKLFDPNFEHSSCGVGFITRKDGKQTHDIILKGHEALCAVPHRGGMSSSGIGDGAGITIDISTELFSKLVGKKLTSGSFGVGNFFLPKDEKKKRNAILFVEKIFNQLGLTTLLQRKLPVDDSKIEPRGVEVQLPIYQWVLGTPIKIKGIVLDKLLHQALIEIETKAYSDASLSDLYPLSLSQRTQVLKGRLNSWEIIPYFTDLNDTDHKVHTLFFHTRFSTNTDPHPSMAQPFRLIAHNGELNTDKKNRLSETAIAVAKKRSIARPKGQSDSCRFDQTLNDRVMNESVDLVTAVVSMMPPAWENDYRLSPKIRSMLEYFSLYEEKNDGPAALVFGDGNIIGARLDRLGLRPLRTVETVKYLAVMSEAGQIYFPPNEITRLGRIEAGGMLYYDHTEKHIYETDDALEKIASSADYSSLLKQSQLHIDDLKTITPECSNSKNSYAGDLNNAARYVAYSHNQESFKFFMDPMLASGIEKVSAMGYGNAINALSDNEGGVAKYFSQKFAQVTNPPLDSIREADGMTLRVVLGEKPLIGISRSKQLALDSPLITHDQILRIKKQTIIPCETFEAIYEPCFLDPRKNERKLIQSLDELARKVSEFAGKNGGIAILSDRNVSTKFAVLPTTLVVAAVNQKLIEDGQRLRVSLIVESGQIKSSHHVACALGFGASAVYALAVQMRAEEKYPENPSLAYDRFVKAAEKALMKTMGKVGLCTVESYSGAELFESNFLDTSDHIFSRYFPNMNAPVGGVQFHTVAQSTADWHQHACGVSTENDIPILGLFKERSEGAGHSYGTAAVRGFVDLTEEPISFGDEEEENQALRLLTLDKMENAFGITEEGYVNTSYDRLSNTQIDNFSITPGFRIFSRSMTEERNRRPAALRDVLAFPADISYMDKTAEIKKEMMLFNRAGNNNFTIRGLEVRAIEPNKYSLKLTGPKADDLGRLDALAQSLVERFGSSIKAHWLERAALYIEAVDDADSYISRITDCPDAIPLSEVQPASEITPRLASGAMSHGALVATAHEAVAHGTNMVGGMSNCGEGGEHMSRFGTIRASRIKQFASARFGVWAGYLADPNLEEIEIKIGQGAKPGEGGQLPAPKVTVEIAAARGGTPGVELISPPPHHDTYSIEDLSQLIHDAKAARVRVVVKLVSSEGIGTIAVGVAKAGADVINIAGSTGGTGAASVTSLKYTGRAAELGIAEVHQALCANGIRKKVLLRCSGAMQTGSDVVKACLLGGDSFEFGTTALMMLRCVMAKNCNLKCPAGLTTNEEAFDGDPRALAQYLVNIAHEVREILANLGLRSLDDARGRANLLHLLDHPASVGQLDVRAITVETREIDVENPTYLESNFSIDENIFSKVKLDLFHGKNNTLSIDEIRLGNSDKSVGGQLSIDIERFLNYEDRELIAPPIIEDERGRRYLKPHSVVVHTARSAGQSYGAFINDGMVLNHVGTCNDGVGKGACGGEIVVKYPLMGSDKIPSDCVLIGNFALFGATGGRLFVCGQAGDRFAVRNSGATAVVEGVGDFCCEYMTNGTVLNIGKFSKGFGNGMSGGFAYQYDPEDRFTAEVGNDSFLIGRVNDGSDMSETHGDTILQLLQWHIEATGSPLASKLMEDWANVKNDFIWLMPRALLQYQDSDEILRSKTRKELLEELSSSLAYHQIKRVKGAWKESLPVLDGMVPDDASHDSELMFELLNNWTVMDIAQEIALRRYQASDQIFISKHVQNLVMVEDFDLMTRLSKHARDVLSDYADSHLAALIAHKRVGDFKSALSRRDTRSMDSPATYSWVIEQDRKNRALLGEIPSFEKLFAGRAIPERLKLRQVS